MPHTPHASMRNVRSSLPLFSLSFFAFLFIFFFSFATKAVTVAVIDSGVDVVHEKIAPHVWKNPLEIPNNHRDEDRNGYEDDLYGWNFAESNSEVIDYKYLGLLDDDIRRFFSIQADFLFGVASEEDMEWFNLQLLNEDFLAKIGVYGNFMHGTHVAGITLGEGNNDTEVLTVKLLPTEVSFKEMLSKGRPFLNGLGLLKSLEEEEGKKGKEEGEVSEEEREEVRDFRTEREEQERELFLSVLRTLPPPVLKGLRLSVLNYFLDQAAKQQMLLMEEMASYVKGHEAAVANGSFGIGWNQALFFVARLAHSVGWSGITRDEASNAAHYFMEKNLEYGKQFVGAASQTLFVFAAGNDGMDNDVFLSSPTNIKSDNVISVAATLDDLFLAPFSNFGASTVDVAAPGVGIESSVPGDQYLRVSGTSQAAPFVSQIAALIKSENKELGPLALKKILMGTVDKKDFLADKVLSQGIVNSERAVRAARLSKGLPLHEAIAQSLRDIPSASASPKSKGTEKGDFFLKKAPSLRNLFILPLQPAIIFKD